MATARQAMLANLRGRFDEATELIAEVAAEGRRAGLADTYRVVASARGRSPSTGGRTQIRTYLIRCRLWPPAARALHGGEYRGLAGADGAHRRMPDRTGP